MSSSGAAKRAQERVSPPFRVSWPCSIAPSTASRRRRFETRSRSPRAGRWCSRRSPCWSRSCASGAPPRAARCGACSRTRSRGASTRRRGRGRARGLGYCRRGWRARLAEGGAALSSRFPRAFEMVKVCGNCDAPFPVQQPVAHKFRCARCGLTSRKPKQRRACAAEPEAAPAEPNPLAERESASGPSRAAAERAADAERRERRPRRRRRAASSACARRRASARRLRMPIAANCRRSSRTRARRRWRRRRARWRSGRGRKRKRKRWRKRRRRRRRRRRRGETRRKV